MKKQLFLIAVAALAMASCSKDETTGINNGNAIDFRAALGTRAAETTTANIEKFNVTALTAAGASFFTDVEFTKDGSFFTSDPSYYWPNDGSNLSFYAYSPAVADLNATVTIDNTTKKLTDYSPAAVIADQKDFITAQATGSKSDESTGVALTFGHRLSQIEIKAKNTNDAYVYKVKGIRIANAVSKGSFDFTSNDWTLATDKANYEVTYDVKTLGMDVASMMATENDNAMLLPQQLTAWDSANDKTNAQAGAYLALLVNICTKDGAQVFPATTGVYKWTAVAIDTNWEAGKKYIYTLDFSDGAGKVDPEEPNPDPQPNPQPGDDILGSPIKFTVTVDAWSNSAASDIAM